MAPKDQICFLFLLIFIVFEPEILVHARITSKKLTDDGLIHIDLTRSGSSFFDSAQTSDAPGRGYTPLLSRARRASSPNDAQLGVHTTILPNPSHNEAVVHWTGTNSSVLFILSREHALNGTIVDSKLWRSEQYGQSFTPVMKLPKDAIISYYLAANRDKKKLLFVDLKNHKIYTTRDEGKSYVPSVGCGTSADRIVFHPTRDDYLLCYCEAERKLYVSPDFAQSWDLIDEFVNPRFFWGVPRHEKGGDERVVHMEVLDPATGQFRFKSVTYPYPREVVLDADLGPVEVDSLLVINEYIFVQRASRSTTWLYVSYQRGPFRMAFFPNNHHPKDLNIIDADESRVFVAGSQPSNSRFYSISNLYLSDVTGQFYITSLETVTELGLREIHGLRGVYTANKKKGVGYNSGLQTFITFDQGGKWVKIPAPEKDQDGKDVSCKLESGCSLHFTHIVSEAKAPGILLGMGSYGDMLTGSNNMSLLMSIDGGVSWKFVLSNHDQYDANILDQGGAVVAVPQTLTNNGPESHIYYSHNEGNSWQQYSYTNDSLTVNAVLNEPGIETRNVLIFGHDNSKPGWVIIMVNFSGILSRQCAADRDYHDWFPRDPQDTTDQCLLGQKLTYKRRNASAECYNGPEYDKAVTNKTCACQDEDYECDYGYDNKAGLCVAAKWFNPDLPVGDCPEGASYNKSKGYRKVAADRCVGELDGKAPTLTTCPMMRPDGLHLMMENRGVVLVGETVKLHLVQERGTKKSTKYTWNFGVTSKNHIFQDFDEGSAQNTTYSKRGVFTVWVLASNSQGQSNVSLEVVVEDKIAGLLVELPRAASVDVPVLFESTLSDSIVEFYKTKPGIHFIWSFGDEISERDSVLTWETSVTHKYTSAGNYTVIVEATNGGDTAFRILNIPVYGVLSTVQLTFDPALDAANDGTVIWQDMFRDELWRFIAEFLGLPLNRLEVEIIRDTSRTVAEVSVLPRKQEMTSDDTIDVIMQQLKGLPKSDFSLRLSKSDFGSDLDVKVTGVNDVKVAGNTDGSHIAVYVCVPILLLAIFVSLLVVVYYKRSLTSRARRYRLLRGQQADGGPEPDSLLNDDLVTDDDDPPLDLNVSGDHNQRLVLSEDDHSGGRDPLGLLSSDRRNLDV